MSERKVLNKYYPPDFDPNNIPRSKVRRNKTFNVRLMAPCNMKCNTCGEYIAKAKKFNSRKEDVEDENYLGLRIYRFYIKCPMCISEIVFKTDPEHTDYIIEAGATRNFQAQILAERQAIAEAAEAEEEAKSNPMKMLENRTKQSRHEMDMIEKLEELKELNQRQADINYDGMLQKYVKLEKEQLDRQEQEDEEYIKSVFGGAGGVKRIISDSGSDEDSKSAPSKQMASGSNVGDKAISAQSRVMSDPLISQTQTFPSTSAKPWERSLGCLGGRSSGSGALARLGIVKKVAKTSSTGGGSDSFERLPSSAPTDKKIETASAADSTSSKSALCNQNAPTSSSVESRDRVPESSVSQQPSSSALGLLGEYSGSDSD